MLSKFKTQKELKNYLRDIINSIGVCDRVKHQHPEKYSILCEAFTRHPRYPEKFIGLDEIKISYHYSSLVVYIVKKNGDIDNVSILNDCVTGKPKDNLKIAMRVAIQPQIDEYRTSQNRLVCELCGDIERIEVDHHSEYTPFAKLYSDFMNTNILPIPTTFHNTIYHTKCFTERDSEFTNNWIEYHKENAILRILCKACNGSQKKYKPPNENSLARITKSAPFYSV